MGGAQLDDLILRAQRRDATAFDALVESYGPRLYGYFYRLTGRRVDAEDLLQELFVRLVSTLVQYDHNGRFDAWLFRIATNLVRDRIRRSQTRRVIAASDFGNGEEVLARLPGKFDSTPAEAIGRAEDLDRLQAAIQQLPEPERMVIMLRHFSQLPFREIAELMDTPIGTALARAHRGLGRLRELMGTDLEGSLSNEDR